MPFSERICRVHCGIYSSWNHRIQKCLTAVLLASMAECKRANSGQMCIGGEKTPLIPLQNKILKTLSTSEQSAENPTYLAQMQLFQLLPCPHLPKVHICLSTSYIHYFQREISIFLLMRKTMQKDSLTLRRACSLSSPESMFRSIIYFSLHLSCC